MSHRSTSTSFGSEEEEVDVRVDLGDDGVVDVEEEMEGLKRDVDSAKNEKRDATDQSARDRRTTKVAQGKQTNLRLPSLNLVPQFQGTISPDLVLFMRTTGLRIPGTAAEAMIAVQIKQSGAVRYCNGRETGRVSVARDERSRERRGGLELTFSSLVGE